MSIADSIMARMGYVKLGNYGLALTPQGRIITTQPAILDDGSGGRIVGWARGDLAELSLATLPVGKAPAPPAAIPDAPAIAFAPTVPMTPVSRPAPPPIPVQVAKTLDAVAQFSTPSMPPAPVNTSDEYEDEDDDWDWQMAVARARAAADEVQAVVAKPPAPAPMPRPSAPQAPALVAPTGVKVTPPPMPQRAPRMTAPVIRDSSMVAARPPAKPTVAPLHAAPAPLPPRRAARGTGQLAGDVTAKVAVAPVPRPAPQRPMPLPAGEDTRTRTPAAPPTAARRPGPAPAPSFDRIEAAPVEDTRVDTRTEIKPAPLPRFSTRFAAAR